MWHRSIACVLLLSVGGPFFGGATPDLADISVFGVLRSIEGYDVFADVMANTHVRDWYARMVQAVGAASQIAA